MIKNILIQKLSKQEVLDFVASQSSFSSELRASLKELSIGEGLTVPIIKFKGSPGSTAVRWHGEQLKKKFRTKVHGSDLYIMRIK